METGKLVRVFKDLATHVKETGWAVFDENVIKRIVEKDFPDSLDIPTKDDLLEYFGVDYLKVNKLKPKCGIKRYNYFFKVRDLDSLKKKIDEKTRQEIVKDCREVVAESHRVDKRIIENVYNFIYCMPCSNTDYTRETGKVAPSDADLMKTLDMCLIDAEIIVERISTSKVRRLKSKKSIEDILAEINNAYKKFYKKNIRIIKKKESEPVVEKAKEEEIITEIIPHKEFPEIFLNRLQRDIDNDRDYKITICILNMMKDERKTGILVTDVFCELKKFGFDCTGLNFGEWCNKNAHFRCVNSQVQLRPGSYCEMIINKRPILSKKEEIKPIVPEVKVEKKEVCGLDSFHILTERKFVENEYLKFEKNVQELNAYCCYVDFNNPESIQTSYELALTIGRDNILGEKVIDKLCNTVLNAIKAYTSNE